MTYPSEEVKQLRQQRSKCQSRYDIAKACYEKILSTYATAPLSEEQSLLYQLNLAAEELRIATTALYVVMTKLGSNTKKILKEKNNYIQVCKNIDFQLKTKG